MQYTSKVQADLTLGNCPVCHLYDEIYFCRGWQSLWCMPLQRLLGKCTDTLHEDLFLSCFYIILRVGASEVCRCKGETNIRFLSSGQHSANDIKDAPHIFSRVDLWEPSVLLPLGLCPITPKKIENLWVLKLLAKSLLDISSNSGVNNLSQMDWSLLCLESKWWGAPNVFTARPCITSKPHSLILFCVPM